MATTNDFVYGQQNLPGLAIESFYLTFTGGSTNETITPTIMDEVLSVSYVSNTAGVFLRTDSFVPLRSSEVDVVASGNGEFIVTLIGRITSNTP